MAHTVLMVIAHPDDESLSGGTLARMVAEGHSVTVVCATRGEVGEIAAEVEATPETLGEVREQELRDAMAVLGIDDVRFLDFRDSGMAGTPENDDPRALVQAEPLEVSMALTAIMQEVYPDIVITWDATGGYGHPDHIRVHETTTDAFANYEMRSGRPVQLYYTALPVHLFEEMGKELRAQGIEWGSRAIRESSARLERPPVTTEIDVSAFTDKKRASLLSHRSQGMSGMPLDKLSEELRRRFVGIEYYHRAVPAWKDSEPLEDSLGRLEG